MFLVKWVFALNETEDTGYPVGVAILVMCCRMVACATLAVVLPCLGWAIDPVTGSVFISVASALISVSTVASMAGHRWAGSEARANRAYGRGLPW